jgi:phage gpG-like protein
VLKFKMTMPKPNLRWYRDSKKELLKVVEDHNRESWAAAKDPVTDKKWAPRKQPTGGHPLLKKSGKMFGTTKFKAGERPFDFKATVGVNYGKFHQNGTSKMPQRRWLGVGSNIDDKVLPIISKRIFKGKVTYSTSG